MKEAFFFNNVQSFNQLKTNSLIPTPGIYFMSVRKKTFTVFYCCHQLAYIEETGNVIWLIASNAKFDSLTVIQTYYFVSF